MNKGDSMLENNMFPVITATGSPYEIGFTHGNIAKKRVEISIETYKAMFWDYSGITWEKAKEYASTFIPLIEDYDKDLLEEMKGIADGSGFDMLDILALNVRSEIVLQGKNIDIDGCTSLALTPDVTKDNNTWIAQNWDWKISQRNAIVILNIFQQNKPNITMATEAGIIGKLGFNDAGIGVCLNALASDSKPEGLPLHIALRGILNSYTLSDVVQTIGKFDLACCANFLVAHSEGEAVTIEVGPKDYDVLYSNNGIITHTNHFTSLRMTYFKDTGKYLLPDSQLRYGRVNHLLKNQQKFNLSDIQEILKDHHFYPDAICRHEDMREEPGKRIGTVFSIIMNLTKLELYIAPACPCETEYQLIKIQ